MPHPTRWGAVAWVVVCGCKFAATDGMRPLDAADDVDSAVADPDAPPDAMPPIDWLHPYAHRKAITLHKEQIAGALTDFPVAIVVTDDQIAAGANATGGDIAFTAGDATTPLAWEIESFSKTSKQLVAWVKVPALSNTADTTLYVYYGDTNPPANDGTKVWTSSFEGVWHMQQDPGPGGTGDIEDATSKHHDGTAAASMQASDSVPAQVGTGMSFDGTQKFIGFGALNLGNSFTISAWVRYTNHNNVNAIFANSGSGFDTDGFRFFVNSVNTSNRRLSVESGNGTAGSGRFTDTNDNAVPLAVFAHVACVVDRTAGTAKLYVDGQQVGSGNIGTSFNANSTFDLGRMQNNLFYFDGILDEIEVAKTQRPIEWLRTAHDTQAHPEMFISLATEETEPPQ